MRTWTAIVPAKGIDAAKTRLSANAPRADLALAFLDDALAAIAGCPTISSVIVVTGDDAIAEVSRRHGAVVIDEPVPSGLNAAIRAGAAACAAASAGPVIAIAGDLPALTTGALDRVLELAQGEDRALLCDAQGTGTAMLLASSPDLLNPMFGADSRARHVHDGCVDLGLDPSDASALAPARRDVDDAVDLADAIRMGIGPRTRAALGLSR